ncbi:juvenile hormone epoxide hydrolase 2-like [Agrilus planipennis]|uniref:Epoxide hydrolase n=1 Tax=Agrilus planipennis TaxID=224129 RepID=A0A7F5R7P9_AGRPL|nr:juvenile hormone epoxide hydrolase 2-like [Agrilus planipennis]
MNDIAVLAFSKEVINDLKDRLSRHRPFIPPLEGVQHQYGINTNLLNKIVEYWKNEYNWKERETLLNKYPHFKTKIQGLDIHFIHVKPTTAVSEDIQVLPILLLHGWPGSVREFYNLIPLLTTPREDQKFVFEVIVPSLPGYGFSDAAVRPGLGPPQVAVIFKNLMVRLGFEKFYVQGGDWGAIITSNIAAMFPQNVLGLHCNMPYARTPWATIKQILGSFYPSWVVDKPNQHRVYPLKTFFGNFILETGYMHLQATKPDTIGTALNDTPVGLAAYILEKFISWTDHSLIGKEDGGLERKFKLDDLLDNVMIYWVTESITTSVCLYAENFSKENRTLQLEGMKTKQNYSLLLTLSYSSKGME